MNCKTLVVAALAALFVLGVAAPRPGRAVDGVIEINQAKVTASGGFPFVISQPGSYRLTGNVTGVSGKDGIQITASGVTLDLNGFALIGVGGSLTGILAAGAATGLSLHNGTIRNWGNNGTFVAAANGRLADLSVRENAFQGLTVSNHSLVTRCTASANGGTGIQTFGGCVVIACAASGNLVGISVDRGVVDDCSALNNTAFGITANVSTVSGCSVVGNGATGIQANGGTVSGCTVAENVGDGIAAFDDCTVVGNSSSSNGFQGGDGAGIHVLGSGNRIDGNHVTFNDRGIDVDLLIGRNLIVRNSAHGNNIAYDVLTGGIGNLVAPVRTDFLTPPGPWDNFDQSP